MTSEALQKNPHKITKKTSTESSNENKRRKLSNFNRKSKFACEQVEWLSYQNDSEVTTTLDCKTEAIVNSHPKNIQAIKMFFCFNISPYKTYKKNLAKLASALETLLKNTDTNETID